MQQQHAKMLFQEGALTACEITQQPLTHHWALNFAHRNGATSTLTDTSGKPKLYASRDNAGDKARDIGFERYCVYQPSHPETRVQRKKHT